MFTQYTFDILPILARSEDEGRLHLTRCIEISNMVRHVLKTKKINFNMLTLVCTYQNFINSKKYISFHHANELLCSLITMINSSSLKKLHNRLSEQFPHLFKIKHVKFKYILNTVSEFNRLPCWLTGYTLSLIKLIFSSKFRHKHSSHSPNLRINLLRKQIFIKRKKMLINKMNKPSILISILFNESIFLRVKKLNYINLFKSIHTSPPKNPFLY